MGIYDLTDDEIATMRVLPPTKEYYGEYSHGFLGGTNQISLCLSAGRIEGRGYLRNMNKPKKATISDISYSMDEFIGVFYRDFDGSKCISVCPKNMEQGSEVCFPGINVTFKEIEWYYKLYSMYNEFTIADKKGAFGKNKQAPDSVPVKAPTPAPVEIKAPVQTPAPVKTAQAPVQTQAPAPAPAASAAPAPQPAKSAPVTTADLSSLSSDIADFQAKVSKLRIMKENGLISDEEFNQLRKNLVNVFS